MTWRATLKQRAYDFLFPSASRYYLAFHIRLHMNDIAFLTKSEVDKEGTRINGEHHNDETALDVLEDPNG